jgi:hypothetical protein
MEEILKGFTDRLYRLQFILDKQEGSEALTNLL